jgi:CHAT domain-containing protein
MPARGVSHWPVESDAAVKLTTAAFSELAKNSAIGRAEALRRSMQKLIADQSSPRNADPAVWAPERAVSYRAEPGEVA